MPVKWPDSQPVGGGRSRRALWVIIGAIALHSSCEWAAPPSIVITAEEFRFIPARIERTAGRPLRLLIRNQGHERHVFHSPALLGPEAGVQWHQPVAESMAVLQENNAIVLEPGQSMVGYVTLSPGLYPFRCWIKGHTGMEGVILVTDPSLE